MKLHQGVATAVVTTAAISAIIVGAYLFGILLFPSLTQRALAGPLLRGERPLLRGRLRLTGQSPRSSR